MKRATRNPAQTRQQIIEKAAPIFNKYGYAGTKLVMLIEATGFQKGGIYCHFDSKMDLARAVFKYNFRKLRALYRRPSDTTLTYKEQLLGNINSFKKYIHTPPITGGCPLLNMAVEADDTDEDNRLLVKACINEWRDELITILENGVHAGEFRADINITQEAFFIIASIEGSIMLGQVKRSIGLMMGVADSLEQYIRARIFEQV